MTQNNICDLCNNKIPEYHNFCSKTECMVELTKRSGGVVYAPNNLPVRCFRADGLMLEHEHGDHPDYIFPVDVEYIAPLTDASYEDYKQLTGEEGTEEQVRSICEETHALLYANGSVAVTMYETCSAAWLLQEQKKFLNGNRIIETVAGSCLGGHMWKSGEWKLSENSIIKILEYVKNKYNFFGK